jgi:peroxiredoxin
MLQLVAVAFVAGCLATRTPPLEPSVAAPGFTMSSHLGESLSLESLLSRGPAVLVFYRGHW